MSALASVGSCSGSYRIGGEFESPKLISTESREINFEGRGITSLDELALFTNLERLNLRDCLLTDSPDLSYNQSLQTLDLGKNGLSHPPNTTALVRLQELYLDENWISTPPDLSKNCFLRILSLSGNPLVCFPDLCNNVILIRLYANSCQLTQPPEIKSLKRLEFLDLGNNQLAEAPKFSVRLVKGEFKTPPFKEIHLENNRIQTLPSRYFFLPKTCKVFLKGNSFSQEEASRILEGIARQRKCHPNLGPDVFFEETL